MTKAADESRRYWITEYQLTQLYKYRADFLKLSDIMQLVRSQNLSADSGGATSTSLASQQPSATAFQKR
jgi:hypothetical protein